MQSKYQKLRKKLREQTKKSRDRDVRVKVELILLAFKLGNVSEACAIRGFSREFYYKWFGRLKRARYDIEALKERTRRPHRSPGQIDRNLEARMKRIHKRGYGAPMIRAILLRDNISVAVSTISNVLNKRQKPSKKRKNKLKAHRRRYELDVPGERMQLDVKYVPEFVGGIRVYNYVIIDECTRWRYARGYYDLKPQSTVDFLKRVKALCPFPIQCIQTDNGFEFTYRLIPSNDSEHPMDQWCRQNKIRHRCIPPGEKELNGKVERSHRIDEQYFYWRAPTKNLCEFNRALEIWIDEYNINRPHGGLEFKTPLQKLLSKIPELSGPQSVQPKNKTGQQLIEEIEIELKKLKYIA